MTTPTSGTSITPSLWTGTTTNVPTKTDSSDKDTFLKLLVAQLKYQDPSNPTDATQFMAQTAQFTMVEKLDDLATATQQQLAASQLQAATTLVGRSITWNDDGTEQTGTVTAVAITDGTPTLQVGSKSVQLSAIARVAPATG